MVPTTHTSTTANMIRSTIFLSFLILLYILTLYPLITPIFIYFLLNYVSGVNLLEERAKEKWGNNPEYFKYLKTTPKFFPKIF